MNTLHIILYTNLLNICLNRWIFYIIVIRYYVSFLIYKMYSLIILVLRGRKSER